MLHIELKLAGATLASFATDNEIITVGRNPKSDIHIDNLAVSNFHAVIKKVMSVYFIEDLKSTNGTFVNEKKIDKYELLDGDQVMIGKHSLIFRFRADTGKPDSLDETMVLDTRKQKELLDKNR